MIKIEHTKIHKDYTILHNGKSLIDKHIEVLVTDAELVLVECKEVKNAILHNIINKGGKFYKPILISRTEKIEVGDWAYNLMTHRYGRVLRIFNGNITIDNNQYEDTSSPNNFAKILALPEHFSPQSLQDIVDGKLKEGKVVLECETVEIPPNRRKEEQHWEMAGLARQDGDMKDADKHTKLARMYQQGESYNKIKLNPYITIYPVEKKMYTREEVIKEGNKLADHIQQLIRNTFGCDYLYNELKVKSKEWFEQYVK
jgi:hypothetical protein